jgi:hypothetical protein
MTLLERFDALCEQLRSLPDPLERELALAGFIRSEAMALDEAAALDIGAALDAMTDDEIREPLPAAPRRCRPAQGSAETLEKLREVRVHRWWFGKWNFERQRVAEIDELKRRLRSAGTPIPRPRKREWC